MPQRSVLLTQDPVSYDEVVSSADAVWEILRVDHPGVNRFEPLPAEDGAALQIYGSDDLLLTVLRPLTVWHLEEVERLLPWAETKNLRFPLIWTTALTPYSAGGIIGIGILSHIIDYRLDATIVHDRLPEYG